MTTETLMKLDSPVAICTLASHSLCQALQSLAGQNHPLLKGVLVAGLTTENIGIEQIIEYTEVTPTLKAIIVCGEDAKQTIGYLPGQSLLALAKNGVEPDETHRIIGAEGKRPLLTNVSKEAIDHFRNTVQVIDCIGMTDPSLVLEKVTMLLTAFNTPLPEMPIPTKQSKVFISAPQKHTIVQHASDDSFQMDPKGYFLVSIDVEPKPQLILKHYTNQGKHTQTLSGLSPKDLYMAAIEADLISRLDHAAYLGRELAWAAEALKHQQAYTQDDPSKID